jgi:hypothetical protein
MGAENRSASHLGALEPKVAAHDQHLALTSPDTLQRPIKRFALATPTAIPAHDEAWTCLPPRRMEGLSDSMLL